VAVVLIIALTTLAVAIPAGARTPVPPPQGGGDGTAIYDPDMALPFSPGSAADPSRFVPEFDASLNAPFDAPAAGDSRGVVVGGDDTTILETNHIYHKDLAAATNGHLFAVVSHAEEDNNIGLTVSRSRDGGTTWEDWATFADPDPLVDWSRPSICVAEGVEDRVFVAWAKRTGTSNLVQVAYSPLHVETADFTTVTVHTQATSVYSVDLASDAATYSDYYLYLVYSARGTYTSQINFTRSTDHGTTFETPYVIGGLTMTDRGYYGPKVAYGYGGYVHVGWTFHLDDDSFDTALRYRRASSFANGGLAAWDAIRGLSDTNNGTDETCADIDASKSSFQVMLGYDREPVDGPEETSAVVVSEDQGATFGAETVLDEDLIRMGTIVQNPTNGNWFACGTDGSYASYAWAPAASPTSWSETHYLSDHPNNFVSKLVLDPAHDHQPAVIWSQYYVDPGPMIRFDAPWRSGDGFPNYQPGFPVDLAHQPISDPAVVDLDGDGDLEIVFGDSGGNIQAFRSDGTSLPDWPVNVGTPLADTPIAIGDLAGLGELLVVAGTADGRVFAYDTDGDLAPGWPYVTTDNADAYVAIGQLGAPNERQVVVTCGQHMHFVNAEGDQVPDSYIWYMSLGFNHGAVIGDIDGDEVNEVVFSVNQLLLAADMYAEYTELYRPLDSTPSAIPSLGDFDYDGDVEIAVPTEDGLLYLVNEDGSDFPGTWPYVSYAGRLRSPAIAQCLGTSEPEICVTSHNWTTHMLWFDGDVGYGYPIETDGWYLYAGPLIGRVNGSSSDAVVGARGAKGWAWTNLGLLIDGWPKLLSNHCHHTPAMGDIDLDGRNEIVFLTLDQLAVVDVSAAPNDDSRTWPMAQHDPQRTGCSDCPEDFIVPVAEDMERVTRISLSAPTPNPISTGTTFAFAVPVRAAVELAVYDVRGRRVALISREEVEAGNHVIAWNGSDSQGRPMASGQYLAALHVRGPGVDQTVSRKVTVLR